MGDPLLGPEDVTGDEDLRIVSEVRQQSLPAATHFGKRHFAWIVWSVMTMHR